MAKTGDLENALQVLKENGDVTIGDRVLTGSDSSGAVAFALERMVRYHRWASGGPDGPQMQGTTYEFSPKEEDISTLLQQGAKDERTRSIKDPLDRMLATLRQHTGYVTLDVERPQTSADSPTASKLAARRASNIERGECSAFLYDYSYVNTSTELPKRPSISLSISRDQALRLLQAGADWIGSPGLRPV